MLAGFGMSQQPRSAVLLAILGVVSVALFPAGLGPFTATHGPASALRTILSDVVEFTFLDVLLIAPFTHVVASHMRQPVWEVSARSHQPPPVLALRC